jgi:23S rRNA U2552 (ribose-2'-O)-methylase RlmE/FtsJ
LILIDFFRYVFINLGGNDITDDCDVITIVNNLVKISRELMHEGVERVFKVERGAFPEWTGMTRERFNKVRRSVNAKLRQHFRENFVNVCKDIRYPKHYHRDQVHPGFTEGGLDKLRCIIINTFAKTIKSAKC